jgi:hypothetical protein
MKTQGNRSPKTNSFTIEDVNDSKAYEIPNNELKRIMIRMINKTTEDIYKHLNAFKEDTNK